MKERTYDLCIGCHEEVRDAVTAEGQHPHGALTEGDSCLSCHLGHTGSDAALVRTPMRNACLDCHSEELVGTDGTVIPDIAAELAERPHHHGPFGDGTCLECHRPHASEHAALLDEAIPAGLYVEYSDDAYSFCFQCHDSRIITEQTTQRTAFRDGDRNLHYVHVKRDKSRTCGVCHEVHASHGPSLMKASVPYGPGGWQLPIDFRETPEGGTCLAGCHQEQGYDHREPALLEGAHLLEGWDAPAPPPDPEKKD